MQEEIIDFEKDPAIDFLLKRVAELEVKSDFHERLINDVLIQFEQILEILNKKKMAN